MRGRVLFFVSVLVIIGLVPLVYWILFEYGLSVAVRRSPGPQAPQALKVELVEQTPSIPLTLSLTHLAGQVEISDGQGGWKLAEEGMVLSAQDSIRTQMHSHATLAIPGFFSVLLQPQSDFRVRMLAENAYRFLLEQGMLTADVMDNTNNLFEVAASTAVARTRDGRFQVRVDKRGLVSVGTTRGNVDLEASGKVVQVKAGFLARVEKGKTPRDPIQIPKQLFLKVRWPTRTVISDRKLVVAGRTEPGARVQVDGILIEVDRSGRFHSVVALREGINRVSVESIDVGERNTVVKSPRFRVDTKADQFQIKTSPDMWKKRSE